MGQSLSNYLSSAAKYLKWITGISVDIYDHCSTGSKLKYHPFLGQQIAERRKWEKPKPEQETYADDTFMALVRFLQAQPDRSRSFFSKEYAVFDWSRLGVFTGFRVSEYAQTSLRKGQPSLTIPASSDVPKQFHLMALAFIDGDFIFYATTFYVVSH